MVLHIGIDCFDSDLNWKIIERLTEFYTKKSYKIGLINNNDDCYIDEIINNYTLTSHEKLLFKAFSRSFYFYGNNWEEFDLCFSNGTFLSDFQYSEPYIADNFIKQVNRYFPELDLYITITDEENSEVMTLNKLNHSIIKFNIISTHFIHPI